MLVPRRRPARSPPSLPPSPLSSRGASHSATRASRRGISQTCPGAVPAAAKQRAPRPAAPRVAALSTRMRLGYDGWRPAIARPAGRVGPDSVAGGPTRTQVRLGRLRESGRGGGCSESDHLPSQNVSSQRAHQLPTYQHPPCSRGESVLDRGRGRVRRRRRDAPICNKGAVLSRPTATRSGERAGTAVKISVY